ncbi:hypothetical protein OPQ81_011216 [Rhizoctonia solani]|nr:hypothetical protein OPQ81_011216 [Rhizoctonia solani]
MYKPYRPSVPQGPLGSLGYGGQGSDGGSSVQNTNDTQGYGIGGWLPRDHPVVERYISKLLDKVKQDKRSLNQLHPTIVEFKNLIDTTPALRMGFTKIFEQVPHIPTNFEAPTLKPQIRDLDTMFKVFDYIITHAIPYEDHELLGFPISGILPDFPMRADAGLAALLMPSLNVQFKKMFDAWGEYLSSPASREYLTTEENGWFGPQASVHLPNFAETYECDPSAEYYGFQSWDDFFTRKFREGVRPVEFAEDNDIINSACESSVYRIAHDINAQDSFWLKGHSYSLFDMLNHDPFADQFVGGTIYQGLLGPHSYHRWHSPVDGVIKKVDVIPGTYFAQPPGMDPENPIELGSAATIRYQSYMANVTTRALFFIDSDNPTIGLMCFIAIGMIEASTCEITIQEGDRIRKGDQLGMFHFGGSTHCLLFRGRVKIIFDEKYERPESEVLLNASIATVGERRRPQ